MIPQKRITLILLCNSVQNWMWDLSAFHDVFWTTCWIAAWRHSVIRLSWGDHYPLLTPYLCASPWIKFLTAACGKTGLRTEQGIVGDVVYLMRLDQRWSNKSELRLLKDSLLLAMWHSQPAKYAEGWLPEWMGISCSANDNAQQQERQRKHHRLWFSQGIVRKWRGEMKEATIILFRTAYVFYPI